MHYVIQCGLILLVLGTLPLTLELLVLSVATLVARSEPALHAHSSLRIAVVIPAHNEETLVAAAVGSLAGASDIYVVAHNCTDRTAATAAAGGATVLPLQTGAGGKGLALDHGFRHALAEGADAVLVLDADSVAGPRLIAAVTSAFAAGAEAVQSRYEVANPDGSSRTRLAALALLGMNVLRPLGRERLGLSAGIFGNGFALSAATLLRVPYTSNSLVEDLEYHLHLVRAGTRVRFLNHAAVFGEMPEAGPAAAAQRARWEGGRLRMRRRWTGPLLGEVLRGRLRLLEPLLDLLALPLSSQALLLLVTLGLGIVMPDVWLTSYAAVGIIAISLYVGLSARLAPDPGLTLRAVAFAPAFVLWKLLLIPRTRLAARRDAAWVRTARNADPPRR